MLEERLRLWAAGRGYRIAIAGTGVVEVVRDKLERRRASGEIEAGFFKASLAGLRFLEGASVPGPARIVMVSVPAPVHVVRFKLRGGTIDSLIPPTYVNYRKTFADVLADMQASALEGAVAETFMAPLKSLAVHMGLVVYGRNNITYVPGQGSGHQLCGYLVVSKEWPAVEAGNGLDCGENVLERCSRCRACLKACPTGAIREDRFLISAERCFTLLSESRKPIPTWARPPKPACLIGCMVCQLVCPENKGRMKPVETGVEFSAGETRAIIAAGRRVGKERPGPRTEGEVGLHGPDWASARAKFEPLGMTEDLDVMGRNLGHFLAKGKKT